VALPDISDLQLLFAQLNNEHFGGEIPAHRIAYNARFSNLAGRITYKPPLIELSPKHFEKRPEALRETLLHEMIHAWLFARGENPAHTARFKKKMAELGLQSIYHELGTAVPRRESAKRFILRCDRCTLELLRKRRPGAQVSCGRCSRRRFDPRYRLRVLEIVETRDLSDEVRAAHAGRTGPRTAERSKFAKETTMKTRPDSYRRNALAALAAFAFGAAAFFGGPAPAGAAIPANTKLTVQLVSQDVNSKNAQPGDPVIFAVVPPFPNGSSRYARAKVYGHVASAVSAAQGRKAQLNITFDKIVFADGEFGRLSATMVSAQTVSENTTARKALGAGAGMAVGSQTIGRVLGGSAGAVVGMLGGAAAGYAYANNAKANFSIPKGHTAVIEVTSPVYLRPQAR